MSEQLKRIRQGARALVTNESYGEIFKSTLDEFLEEFKTVDGRTVGLEPLLEIVQKCMQLYKDKQPLESDKWLAPRVHASLRLYRAEAADLGMWEYLTIAVPEIREYVLWRWIKKDGTITLNRVWGQMRRHALARLWWAAELTRNGPDYQPAQDIFLSQDGAEYVTDTLQFQNRAAAIAYARLIKETKGNKEKAVNAGTGLNHILMTIVLDTLVPEPGVSMDYYEPWVKEDFDHTLMYEDMPTGPNEEPVSEEYISAAYELLPK